MKTTYPKIWSCLLLIIVLFVSCTNKTDDVKPIPTFSGYAKNIKAYSGHNRVKLTFEVSDDNIDHFVLLWNNKANSKTISKNEANSGIINVIIDGLNEGNHSFNILAYDQSNKPADASNSVSIQAYGVKYINSLKNRVIEEVASVHGKDPVLDWADAATGEIALDIYYTNKTSKPDTIRIPYTQKTVTLPGHLQNTTIEYRALYLPVIACIDTFYSEKAILPEPTYYASYVTKNLIKKSGIVSQVISQSAFDIHADVEYSTVRFNDKSNKPLSVFILQADLSGGKLTLSPLMADNDTKFKLQPVKEMVEARNQGSSNVLAGVNADFFDWTGVPWGPVIINGTIVKNYAKIPNLTYFGITKDGKPQIGRSTSLTELQYANYSGLVGGGEPWIVFDGNKVTIDDNREPRTSVGYSKDNMVYIVVVDGRKADHSVGVSITDLAKIMHSLGSYQAINLDGGGSSTMVIKEGSSFNIVNRYSDPTPRGVATGLAIMIK